MQRRVATTILHGIGTIEVTYHTTKVVDYNISRGSIILNTGGWKTVTTKLRMNQASHEFNLGYSVFQKDHVWYVFWQGEALVFDDNSIELKLSE